MLKFKARVYQDCKYILDHNGVDGCTGSYLLKAAIEKAGKIASELEAQTLHGLTPIVMTTIGLAIAMRNGGRASYSAEAHPFPSLFTDKLFHIAGITLTLADVAP